METKKSKISFYNDGLIGSISSHSKKSKQKFTIWSIDFSRPFCLSCIFIFRNERNWKKKSAMVSSGLQIAKRLSFIYGFYKVVASDTPENNFRLQRETSELVTSKGSMKSVHMKLFHATMRKNIKIKKVVISILKTNKRLVKPLLVVRVGPGTNPKYGSHWTESLIAT